MKITVHGVMLILISVLQATWFSTLTVFGVQPNLFIVYTVLTVFYCKKGEAAILGGICGFLLDVLIGRCLGMNMVLGILTAYVTAYLCEKVFRTRNLPIMLCAAAVFSLLWESVYYAVVFGLVVKNFAFGYVFPRIIAPEVLYNCVAAVVLALPLRKVLKFLYADKGEGIG